MIWRWGRKVFWGALVWLFVSGLLVIQIWPSFPQSKSEWLLLLVFGPPAYVLLEAFGDWMFSRRHGHAISSREFSVVRIMTALVIVLASLFFMLLAVGFIFNR